MGKVAQVIGAMPDCCGKMYMAGIRKSDLGTLSFRRAHLVVAADMDEAKHGVTRVQEVTQGEAKEAD